MEIYAAIKLANDEQLAFFDEINKIWGDLGGGRRDDYSHVLDVLHMFTAKNKHDLFKHVFGHNHQLIDIRELTHNFRFRLNKESNELYYNQSVSGTYMLNLLIFLAQTCLKYYSEENTNPLSIEWITIDKGSLDFGIERVFKGERLVLSVDKLSISNMLGTNILINSLPRGI